MFKFEQENSCDRTKILAKTNSTASVTSQSSLIENLNSKNVGTKNTIDEPKLYGLEMSNSHNKQMSQIKYQKSKKNYNKQSVK